MQRRGRLRMNTILTGAVVFSKDSQIPVQKEIKIMTTLTTKIE
jgi:hypothetical protein